MKKNLLPRFCAITMALTAVAVSKAGTKRIQAWYRNSSFPTICNIGGTLPNNCGATNTGTICTVNGNTYYANGSCTIVYYRQF